MSYFFAAAVIDEFLRRAEPGQRNLDEAGCSALWFPAAIMAIVVAALLLPLAG